MVTVPQSIKTSEGRYPTPEEYAAMFESFSTLQRKPGKVPGRKKKIGTLDTSTGHVGWFMGYCPDGHKVIVTADEMKQIKINVTKTRRSMRYKVFKYCWENWA